MIQSRFPVLVLLTFVGLTSVNWSPEDAGIRLSDPEVLKHHGTMITPVLDEAMPQGKNILWCATFQMAWDSATRNFGASIRLAPACDLADSLNRNPFDRRWVDEGSFFLTNGRVNEGVMAKIDDGMKKLTGGKSKLAARLKNSLTPDDLVFFACLSKDLEFSKPFGRLGTWKLGKRSVPWFGFTPEQRDTGPLLKQVRVHHYAAKDNFVIELLGKTPDDQIILAKLPALPKTPGEVSRNMLKQMRADAPSADASDLLAVPNIVAKEFAEFSQLEGRRVIGNGLILRKAMQSIDFQMDEKGAKLRSEGGISFGCSMQHHVVPRLMILDPPFALIMKRKTAPQPYFVAWFANTDLLGKP